MQMARYSSRDDQGYRAIYGVLQAFVRQEVENQQIPPTSVLLGTPILTGTGQ